jgi:hypothetical protein
MVTLGLPVGFVFPSFIGLFKLSWQALMPTTLLLLAMVPLPDDHNKIQVNESRITTIPNGAFVGC